jgi:hypothetical protein
MVKADKLTRIYFDRIYTDDIVKPPMTPGKWVSDINYIPVSRIGMSCGGGVGGSFWYEYITNFDVRSFLSSRDDMILVKTWKGKNKIINKRYIVDIEDFDIAFAEYNSENYNFEKGIYTCYYLVEPGHELTLVD